MGKILDASIDAAIEAGQWILGPQVNEIEGKLANFAGVKHCVSCANGTDALVLILRAWEIGTGDAVFVPAFTFPATAEAVCLVGASPVFVDVDESFNMDVKSLLQALRLVRRESTLRPRVVIPVDLFGRPAEYRALEAFCSSERLKLLCDCAQSFGARYHARRAGALGDAATTSFFPAKPLGCYGDGGACLTNDDTLAEILRSLRMHGSRLGTHEIVRIGMNSRLDTIQAAILLEKLRIFPDELDQREKAARRYNRRLGRSNLVQIPMSDVIDGTIRSSWSQYTVRVQDRDRLSSALKAAGIPSAVYYALPLPAHAPYSKYLSAAIPVSNRLAETALSLPMHPYLDEASQDRVIECVLDNAAPLAPEMGGRTMHSTKATMPSRPKVARRYNRRFKPS